MKKILSKVFTQSERIQECVRLKRERERKQQQLISDQTIWHGQILDALHGRIDTPQYHNFSRCGADRIFRTCIVCGSWTEMRYRCQVKWCPLCNYRIANARRDKLSAWATTIDQPKHLVLTMRNVPILTRTEIRKFTRALARMRKQPSWQSVEGGCASVEITNEGSGWHIHAHLLVDVRWLDMSMVAREWGELVGQHYGIVYIRDARDRSYLGEVTKYVVKSSDLATWAPEHILEFVTAIRGCRFFFAFGSLFARRAEVAALVALDKPPPPQCECGCTSWTYRDEAHELLHQLRTENKRK